MLAAVATDGGAGGRGRDERGREAGHKGVHTLGGFEGDARRLGVELG